MPVVQAEQAAPDTETLVRTVVANVDRRLGSDPARIEEIARKHVGALFESARVKTFVGVLAERHVVAELGTNRAA